MLLNSEIVKKYYQKLEFVMLKLTIERVQFLEYLIMFTPL